MRNHLWQNIETEVKSLHEIIASVQVKIRMPEDINVTAGNMATVIHGLGIEKKLVEDIIRTIDRKKVEEYCGSKNARGNGSKRYRRAGTTERHPVTCVGRLDLKLHLVEDRLKTKNKTFRPVEDVIGFDGKKVYQEDISMVSAELATKMTYRDAAKEGGLFTLMPSPSTINRRVIHYGKEIQEINGEEIHGARIKTVFPDATKCHSQENDKPKNEINITLGLDEKGDKVLLDARVNKPWEDTAKALDKADALDKKAGVIGDGDREMINAMVTGERENQMDLLHIFRTTGYKLWQDAELSLNDRKAVVRELESILYTLKNSVDKHLKDKDTEALKRRINLTVDALKRLAKRLLKLGCYKAAEFIRQCSNTAVTFARLAVKGVKVPWNSNIIERLMGEISKRCKHKWMRWTTKGLEAILNIILVRYTSEERYQKFKKKITKAENLKFINGEVKIIAAGGEL
jgi:hypothetical protein